MMNEEQINFICQKAYKRLDLAISSETDLSRNKVKRLIEQGFVLVNQEISQTPSKKILEGYEIIININNESSELQAKNQLLEILYQDDDLAVINKKPGITVHPCPSCQEETLVHGLLYHFPELREMGKERPGIVHRLDKDTSGLMLIALNEKTRLLLVEAFAQRKVKKTYLALVQGLCEDGESFAEIGRHPTYKTKMAIVPANQGGREASTSWKRIFSLDENIYPKGKAGKMSEAKNFSLLSIKIATGRTHQIRVHLSAKGHALLGDQVYADQNTAKLAPRQMLHAHKLEFTHPITQKNICITSAPPEDFVQTVKNLTVEKLFFQTLILTGKSGVGKSAVLEIFKKVNIQVFNADATVQELYSPNQDAWTLLMQRYGDKYFTEDFNGKRQVDKKALFEAMQNPNIRKEIEGLIHPLVFAKMQEFFAKEEKIYLQEYSEHIKNSDNYENTYFAAAEIPLWHESKHVLDKNDFYNCKVICISCNELERIKRLEQRGWSEIIIAKMDSWQFSQEDKAKMSDYQLDNTSGFEQLELNLTKILEQINQEKNKKLSKIMDRFQKAIQEN